MNSVLCLKCLLTILTMVEFCQMEHSNSVHRCIHDEIPTSQIRRTTVNYTNSQRDKRSVLSLYKHLRVTPYYYDLSILDSDSREKVEIIVKKAVNLIQHVLSVIPVSGPLLFSRTFSEYCHRAFSEGANSGKCSLQNPGYQHEMCEDVQIPDDHLEGAWLWNSTHTAPVRVIKPQGGGITHTDIVIYVTTSVTSDCESEGTLAHAKFCRVDQNGRPVAGYMNLCPHSLQDSIDVDKLTAVVIHEVFHILGFTKYLYDEFRDCSDSATGLDCPRRVNTVVVDSNGQSVLVTPTVKRKAKEHFNCYQTDFGGPLEELKSHWEMRMMAGSIMAPVITQAHVTFLDPITLAVFEDTGWYKADYEHAQSMLWGQNAGCDFGLLDTCSDSPFFCTNDSISGCHHLHGDKGSCLSNTYLESCSLFTVSDNGLCSEANNSYFSEDLQQTGELYGTDSKCFVADLMNETFIGDDEPKGRCYQTRCDREQETYQILVAGAEWHSCQPNHTLTITGYSGEVHCPSFEVICQNRSSILSLLNSLPDISETSTLHPTTEYQEPGLTIPYDDTLVIEIVFDDNASYILEDEDVDFLDAVNQMVLSITNVSQDRLDVFEVDITKYNLLVTLSVQQSTVECKIPSYDVYKSLKTVVESNKFTILHCNENLTATTIRIIENSASMSTSFTPIELAGATLTVILVFSTIGATALAVLLACWCKRKACSQRVAPLDTVVAPEGGQGANSPPSGRPRPPVGGPAPPSGKGWRHHCLDTYEISHTASQSNIKMQPCRATRKNNPKM